MYTSKPDWTPATTEGGFTYYGYPNRAAEFYLDRHLLPVTPHTFKINNNNENESDQLVDGHPITIPKLDKAQTISMDFIFLHDQRFQRNRYSTFTSYDDETMPGRKVETWFEVMDLTDWLWNKKAEREPVILTVIYPNQKNLNLRLMLDDYSYTQSAENASDYEFSLTFTEYHEALNQEIDMELQNTLIRHNLRALRQKEDPGAYVPQTYETETGKHTMTWEEMKSQIEAWLKVEYGKISDKEYSNFDECFAEWWNSDEDRKKLHVPSTPRELQLWWNDFMEKSKEEQDKNSMMESFEAWLNVEVGKLSDQPPSGLWERFKLWWDSDPSRAEMHMPSTEAELTNWWNDFMAKSKDEQNRNKTLADIEAWLDVEIKKITPSPPESFEERLQLWWDSDPWRKENMQCPKTQEELLIWWNDFMNKSQQNAIYLAEIEAWLNVEIKKVTDSPPKSFRERFELWWNSDETRKNTMHLPSTDDELVNWWKDFKLKSEEEALKAKKWGDIKAWLNEELKKVAYAIPEDFWEGFKIWWELDEERKSLHMPDNEAELFNWWDDFIKLSKGEGD